MYKILIFVASLLVPIYGKICPLDDNIVCNSDIKLHKCVCAVPTNPENPVPERSCGQIVDSNDEDFEGVSITFNLDESADRFDNFSQEDFRTEVSKALKIPEERMIILRIACQDDDEKLAVQFVILKDAKALDKVSNKKGDSDENGSEDEDSDKEDDTRKNSNEDEHKESHEMDDEEGDKKMPDEKSKQVMNDNSDEEEDNREENNSGEDVKEDKDEFSPYRPNQLLDANKLVSELKLNGHGSQIADLDVDDIKVVSELVAVESTYNNTLLLFEALAVVLGVTLTCFLACYFTCKKCRKQDEYLDTLQKA